MGLISEFKFAGGGFVRIALSNQFFSETALEFSQPMAWGTMEMLPEEALQLAFGNRTQRGHLGRAEVCLPGNLFPLLNC